MKSNLKNLFRDESGQDLTEYSLLIVFVLLAIIGLASNFSNDIAGIVGVTNSNLAAGQTAAS